MKIISCIGPGIQWWKIDDPRFKGKLNLIKNGKVNVRALIVRIAKILGERGSARLLFEPGDLKALKDYLRPMLEPKPAVESMCAVLSSAIATYRFGRHVAERPRFIVKVTATFQAAYSDNSTMFSRLTGIWNGKSVGYLTISVKTESF